MLRDGLARDGAVVLIEQLPEQLRLLLLFDQLLHRLRQLWHRLRQLWQLQLRLRRLLSVRSRGAEMQGISEMLVADDVDEGRCLARSTGHVPGDARTMASPNRDDIAPLTAVWRADEGAQLLRDPSTLRALPGLEAQVGCLVRPVSAHVIARGADVQHPEYPFQRVAPCRARCARRPAAWSRHRSNDYLLRVGEAHAFDVHGLGGTFVCQPRESVAR